jgi:hypothetical protein
MARTIISARDAQAGKIAPADSFSARLVKYIPAEVITLYLTMDSIIKAKLPSPATQPNPHLLQTIIIVRWIVFLILLLGTPLYLLRVAKISKITQVVIATISFCSMGVCGWFGWSLYTFVPRPRYA